MKVEEGSNEVVLFVTLPLEYPSASPPIYQLSAPWLKGPERQDMCGQLEEVYLENVGEPVLFQWIEKLRCILQKKCEQLNDESSNLAASSSLCEVRSAESEDCHMEIPLITHGDIITDRKSVFQGHVAAVVTVDQVRLVLSQLYENKKIANATHNIYAYRIYKGDTKTFLQDCEDDGETHAGGRLLHLLQILDIKDAVVVVSRWYGGILLGPDRFRHINNAARQVLEYAGHVKQAEGASAGSRQIKKKR
ncbi:protein IMPACT-like isoform X2 [Hetaerina americana]